MSTKSSPVVAGTAVPTYHITWEAVGGMLVIVQTHDLADVEAALTKYPSRHEIVKPESVDDVSDVEASGPKSGTSAGRGGVKDEAPKAKRGRPKAEKAEPAARPASSPVTLDLAPVAKPETAQEMTDLLDSAPASIDKVEAVKERKMELKDVQDALMAASNRGVGMGVLRGLIQSCGGVERISMVPAEKFSELVKAFQSAK